MCAMRAWTLSLLLLGCGAPGAVAPRPQVPPVEARVEAWVGTHLSGAKAGVEAPEAAPSDLVRLEWSWSWGAGLAALAPEELAASARLQVAVDRAEPFPAVSGQLSRTRLVTAAARPAFESAAQTRVAGRASASSALLFPGSTARCIAAGTKDGLPLAAVEVQRNVSGGLDLACVVPARVVDEDGARSEYRERLLYDAGLQFDGGGLVLVLPDALVESSRANDGTLKETRSDLVLQITASKRDGLESGAEWDAMRALVQATGESASRGGRVPSRDESFLDELVDAWGELGAAEHRRAAWLHLAGTLAAPLAQDYGFLAADEELAASAGELKAALDAEQLRATPVARLAVVLEAQVLRRMAALAGEGKLDDELRGLLLLHAGEAGRWPGAFDDLVRDARSIDELRTRFVKENEAFLEDASPAARVRAHDWLAARGLAVPGYDPMAARETRAAALARYDEAREPLEAAR